MNLRWWIAAALLAGGLFVAGFTLLREAPKLEATLSDGTIARFEKAAMGTIPYDSYPPVKAAIAGYVPNRFQSHLGNRFKGSFGVQTNHLGLLFSVWGADGKRKDDTTRFLSRIEFVESTGYVFRTNVSGYSASGNMILFDANAFPRRDPMLHFRCYEQDSDQLLFELHVPNPGYQPTIPDWSPEPIPASQTKAPLTVTLKHGLTDFTEIYLRDQDLELTSTDPRWTNKTPQRQFWMTDATGNRAYDLTGLSPFEPAWKLSLLFRKNAEAEFAADEVWKTGQFAVPNALTAEKLNLKQTVSGVEVAAMVLCSAGAMRIEGDSVTVIASPYSLGRGTSMESGTHNGRGFTTIHSGLPFIQVNHSQLDEEAELITTIRDQTGAAISALTSGWYGSNGQSMRIVQFEPKPETTMIQLEIIVNRGRTFEFLVAPPATARILP